MTDKKSCAGVESGTTREDYHKRPEWSYSQLKVILDSGIDYAVAAKRGMIEQPSSKAIDLGQIIHTRVLGGGASAVVSQYDNFRTKEAREWRDKMAEEGKIVLTETEMVATNTIVNNIINHPKSEGLLFGQDVQHEVEMFAKTSDGLELRGKADALKIGKGHHTLTLVDLKTTSQFDSFKYRVQRNHYDLQAANYTLIGSASQKIDPGSVDYWFCVAETVPPYRVQFMYATPEFVSSGERKLAKCVEEVLKFGDKDPNFMLEEVIELGDWSI